MNMSWLFGVGNKGQGDPPQFPVPPPPGSGGDGGGDGGKGGGTTVFGKQMDAYRFDSAALERAAKAAKELEHSSMWLVLTLPASDSVTMTIPSLFASVTVTYPCLTQ